MTANLAMNTFTSPRIRREEDAREGREKGGRLKRKREGKISATEVERKTQLEWREKKAPSTPAIYRRKCSLDPFPPDLTSISVQVWRYRGWSGVVCHGGNAARKGEGRKEGRKKRGDWKGKREHRTHAGLLLVGFLRVLYTHFAATYYGPEVACLQGLFLRPLELAPVLDHRHPKADLVRVVMAVFFVAFDERRRPEVFQTGSGTGQWLPTTLSTSARVLRTRRENSPIYFATLIDVTRE